MSPTDPAPPNLLLLRDAAQRSPTGNPWPLVEEVCEKGAVEPSEMDTLWSLGWRHFAAVFFRYSLTVHGGSVATVVPLRIRLADWAPSTSQARVERRNRDLEVTFGAPIMDDEHRQLFWRHARRFTANVPERLENFVGPDPGRRRSPRGYPCECVEVSARRKGELVAASYLDVGRDAASSVYAMFELMESRRSLGVATFLWEIAYARARGCRFLYPGYVFAEASHYDYKKKLGALDIYDWRTWRRWDPRPEKPSARPPG